MLLVLYCAAGVPPAAVGLQCSEAALQVSTSSTLWRAMHPSSNPVMHAVQCMCVCVCFLIHVVKLLLQVGAFLVNSQLQLQS
jgi:hypothetical protein